MQEGTGRDLRGSGPSAQGPLRPAVRQEKPIHLRAKLHRNYYQDKKKVAKAIDHNEHNSPLYNRRLDHGDPPEDV